MAHYTILDENNIVTNFFAGHDENNGVDWEEYYGKLFNKVCKRTSINTCCGYHWTDPSAMFLSDNQSKAFRYNCGYVGSEYDPINDAFIMQKPTNYFENTPRDLGYYVYKPEIFSWVFKSNGTLIEPNWIFNSITGVPQYPNPYPSDGKIYKLVDGSVDWIEVEPPTE
jgi:hypothetical protein